MIRHLYVRDYAVIDELGLDFGPRINLLTGETGAGKSIIVDAIAAALGERADADSVRSGCSRALVEAEIEVTKSPEAMQLLEEPGISPEDGMIIVGREIQSAGRSQCRINGRPVTVSLLKSVTDRLVDTHGQHEHQHLLNPARHLDVLDSWCGKDVLDLRRQVASLHSEWNGLKKDLERLNAGARERARMADLYQFQNQEIELAKLQEGEEDELQAERLRLANAEKLQAGVSEAFELLSERDRGGSALAALSDALGAVQGLARVDERLAPLVDSLQTALYQAEDAARELRGYRYSIEFNPVRLESIQERLEMIQGLKRKYGETIADIVAYGEKIRGELDMLEHGEEQSEELRAEIEKSEAAMMEKAAALSKLRAKGAEKFAGLVEGELNDLGMSGAVFQVCMKEKEVGPEGLDEVEFLISANPGEPPRPLARIASGGEVSRIMLAIKSVMSRMMDVPILIFDEIDVGVGGRTADVIARKLAHLAESAQVICITHLPQIARLPGEHFRIEKEVADGRTVVRARKLTQEERVQELARMLGGEEPSEAAVRHAEDMLTPAGQNNSRQS